MWTTGQTGCAGFSYKMEVCIKDKYWRELCMGKVNWQPWIRLCMRVVLRTEGNMGKVGFMSKEGPITLWAISLMESLNLRLMCCSSKTLRSKKRKNWKNSKNKTPKIKSQTLKLNPRRELLLKKKKKRRESWRSRMRWMARRTILSSFNSSFFTKAQLTSILTLLLSKKTRKPQRKVEQREKWQLQYKKNQR